MTLPAEYVRDHVELGYAVTAHQAQGRTVDTTHSLIGMTATRETLYVAATRGRDANTIYLDTSDAVDDAVAHDPGPGRSAEDIFTGALDRIGSDVSAHAYANRARHAPESNSPAAVVRGAQPSGIARSADSGAEPASATTYVPSI